MSPVGGVGINLAIADAVATATILAEPLLAHHVTEDDLAKVQRRRKLPAVITQTIQRLMHRAMRRTLLRGEMPKPPEIVQRALATLLSRLPALSAIPAYVIGVGVRPERAPDFARRTPR
jgi:2-polyprenyl-6-methoxyphenol hydroxylase-like FAD-dependent oxidoreductase